VLRAKGKEQREEGREQGAEGKRGSLRIPVNVL